MGSYLVHLFEIVSRGGDGSDVNDDDVPVPMYEMRVGVDPSDRHAPADLSASELPIGEVADAETEEKEERREEKMKRVWCWLFGHNTFAFVNGTEVCRRCFKWWGIA